MITHTARDVLLDKVHWEATAIDDQFTTSFKGKYSVLIEKVYRQDGSEQYWVKLKNSSDRELLRLHAEEVFPHFSLRDLYIQAQRESLNVDSAIDEILGGEGRTHFDRSLS